MTSSSDSVRLPSIRDWRRALIGGTKTLVHSAVWFAPDVSSKFGHMSEGPSELPRASGKPLEVTEMTLPLVPAFEPRNPRTNVCAVCRTRV